MRRALVVSASLSVIVAGCGGGGGGRVSAAKVDQALTQLKGLGYAGRT